MTWPQEWTWDILYISCSHRLRIIEMPDASPKSREECDLATSLRSSRRKRRPLWKKCIWLRSFWTSQDRRHSKTETQDIDQHRTLTICYEAFQDVFVSAHHSDLAEDARRWRMHLCASQTTVRIKFLPVCMWLIECIYIAFSLGQCFA